MTLGYYAARRVIGSQGRAIVTGMPIQSPTHVRVHTREALVLELTEFAEDRDSQGKHERAAAARATAAELAAGAEHVLFERVRYQVSSNGPDRYTVYTGSRDEVLGSLRDGALGWAHFGSSRMESQIATAIGAVERGADMVRVGHLVYEIVSEPMAGLPDGPSAVL